MAGINHKAVKIHGEKGLATEWNDNHEMTGNFDVEQHQFLNNVIENVTSFPVGPVEGQVIYRSDQHTFYHWNGTIWVALQGPATVVVAADGSGMTTDIQEGVNMLPATGGVVYIKEGTYIITEHITIPYSNISIFGAGASTIIKCNIDEEYIFLVNLKNKIIIRDLSLLSDGGTRADYGIVFASSEDSLIINCWIKGFSIHGISTAGVIKRLVIDGNHVESSGQGFHLDAESVICINNYATACTKGIYAIITETGSIIDGNFCYSNTEEGIYFRGGNNALISNNISYSNTEDGIKLQDTRYSNCVGNNCYSNGASGITLFNDVIETLIASNSCCVNGEYGIDIEDGTSDRNLVHGAFLQNNTEADQYHDGGDDNVWRDIWKNGVMVG